MHKAREMELKETLNLAKMKQEQKQEIEAMRNQLLTLFVQELRTPLSLIIAPLKEMSQENDLSAKLLSKVRVAYRNSLGMLDACNQLLAIYTQRPLAEKLEVSRNTADKIMDKVVFAVSELVRMNQIDFHYEKKTKKELEIWVDSNRIRFVLHNLLSNAFNHVRLSGSVHLSMQETVNDGVAYCTITVSDSGKSGPVTFGEAVIKDGILQKTKLFSIGADEFFEADDWNYDVYAYNSSTALQAVLSAHVVDMEKPIEKEFFLVEKKKISSERILKISKAAILEDTGLCADLIEELSISRPITGIEVKNGDLLLAASRNRVYTAVVYNEQGTMVADAAITVIRSKGKYTGEYMKMYLDGPVGTLFLEAIHAGDALGLKRSRLMRIPFPDAPEESISTVTELCRTSVERLSAAAANWRESKKRAVQLMMGKS